MYKCDHCEYSSKRLCDLRRHEHKKNPCYIKLEDNVCNTEDPENLSLDPENLSLDPENLSLDPENLSLDPENLSLDPENLSPQNLQSDKDFSCSKCNKTFTRKDHMKVHEKKCDGLDIKQCNKCLRMFTTYQSKWKHTKLNKCHPPTTTIKSQIINNNIDNSVTNNNILNLNFHGNFDTITKNDISSIIKQLERSDYINMIQKNMKLGKYAAPRTIEFIYFNDNHPELQTLKKQRRNDKMVEVRVDGKWEKRLINDIMKTVMKKVEECHNEYIKHLEEMLKNIPIESKEWKIATRPIKIFGNNMIWYNGFLGVDIENIGVKLNRLEDDRETKARNKDMAQLIKEKLYELTPNDITV
jgi:hypothetical protein